MGSRLRRWLRQPLARKAASVQFHELRWVERFAAMLMRAVDRLNLATLRHARFEALAARSDAADHRIRISSDDGAYGERSRSVIEVASQTLDTVIGSLDARSTLVWMDTQGYEGQVLLGATNIVAARTPLVLEFWPYGLDRTQSYAALRAAVMRYESYYDLCEADPKATPTSEIDALYRTLEGSGGYTDLLLT